MRENGLRVKGKNEKKYCSYKGEISPEVPNIIQRDFKANKPNQKWLTDVTEFSIPAGKIYLSPMIDCYDGMPVAWSISRRPDAQRNVHPDVTTDGPAGSSECAKPDWSGQYLKRDVPQTIQPVKDYLEE